MPRWLSEGISVMRKGEKTATWAEALQPRFRAMLLDDTQFTPLESA